MEILMLNHNQERFGTYWRCLWLGKGLAALGYKVTLLCASGKDFDLLVRRQNPQPNLTIITLPRFKYGRYFTGQLIRLFYYLYYVLFYPYDTLHAFTVAQPQIGIPALVGKLVRRKRLIVDWDDLWGGGFADYHSFPIRQVLSFCERFIPRFADKITVVSEDLKEKTLALGISAEKVNKVPNGANTQDVKPLGMEDSRQRLGLDPGNRYVVSIGNTYYSSLKFLLSAFRLVRQREPKAKLLLVGLVEIPEECQEVYALTKTSVVVAGSKPFKDMPYYLAAADVLALPMGPETIEVARYPIRLGDYLASGRPIVSNAVGEVKLVLENYHCGLTSPVDSVELFTENILRVFADSNLAQALGQKALYAAGQLSWDAVTKQLIKVYDNCSDANS